MARKSFAEISTSAQLLVEAISKRGENLPIGVTSELKDQLSTVQQKAVKANVEQEKLKALLKEKTAELDGYITQIEELYTHLKKYIKMGVPQELWREFGIEDKR